MTEKELKYDNLIEYLKSLKSVVIAFSGGVDSTFLLKAAQIALKDKVLAVTIQSPYIPLWEIEEAKELTSNLGVEHQIINTAIINDIKNNPQNRCYLCKKAVFNKIIEVAHCRGYDYVVDGTNFDDIQDYRPGLKALEELNVLSPLKECKITKEEVRFFSKQTDLPTWNKPAYACLLTRIPYNVELNEAELRKIENAESVLMNLGFKAVRVRCHNDLARIELNKEDIKKIISNNLCETISEKIKDTGFKYVTIDLDGYKMGSFNN